MCVVDTVATLLTFLLTPIEERGAPVEQRAEPAPAWAPWGHWFAFLIINDGLIDNRGLTRPNHL